ncbi:3-phytase [Chitinophaga skermanii]|uniref:3-phytase n=2 Tax=Chitinophaga skermanii TaxID=331697 RepID=A0A327R3A3_9BACT|nr:3-phytase [Chitinophaga skermanii]
MMGVACVMLASCQSTPTTPVQDSTKTVSSVDSIVRPVYVSDTVRYDSDDPAFWINPTDTSSSLVIGTDKEEDGALYVYNLQGKVIEQKVVRNLKRPNNVDVGYGLMLKGKPTDIAVTTERLGGTIRIFAVPSMEAIDGGGIEVFKEEKNPDFRAPMGVALYKDKQGTMYAFVGRKDGPSGEYIWQYKLSDDGTGKVKATVVRKFGHYSGKKEIESIAVDAELGYVYYSDEQFGVHQYYADPAKGNEELSVFAKEGFTEDHEGISIYKLTDTTGYIIVSDQGANKFHIFRREGEPGKPFEHPLLKVVKVQANKSDGSEVTSLALPGFPKGLFVAMSDNKTFEFYRWEDIAGKELQSK